MGGGSSGGRTALLQASLVCIVGIIMRGGQGCVCKHFIFLKTFSFLVNEPNLMEHLHKVTRNCHEDMAANNNHRNRKSPKSPRKPLYELLTRTVWFFLLKVIIKDFLEHFWVWVSCRISTSSRYCQTPSCLQPGPINSTTLLLLLTKIKKSFCFKQYSL